MYSADTIRNIIKNLKLLQHVSDHKESIIRELYTDHKESIIQELYSMLG